MLTVCFTLLVAPLLVLADKELLLQIVTTNAPTAEVLAAYGGVKIVYGAKFVGERRYVFVVKYDGANPPVDMPFPDDAVVMSDAIVDQATYFSFYDVDFPTGCPELSNDNLHFIERKSADDMHTMLKTHYERVAKMPPYGPASVFMSVAPIPHKDYFFKNWNAANITSILGKNADALGGPGELSITARRIVQI
ncbi:hypothetical protein BaRGS_00029459 [Batillaria attramentaria]|uniref:Amine oxidase n=1 Tax=Batillaria attramentaria TaxID=370345 RepID=A0ABD0JX12_9CAEN